MTDQVRVTEDGGASIGPTLESLTDYEGDFVERVESDDPPPNDKHAGTEKLLAGKYKSVEELEKGYLEQQKLIGKKAAKAEEAPKAEPKEGEEAPKAEPEEGEEAPKAEPEDAFKPVDFAALNAEFAEKGELSEETLASLEKLGFPKEAASLFFAGVEAIQTLRVGEVHSIAGGKEQYDALVEWGSKNLSEAERTAFDTAVDKAVLEGDDASIRLLIPGIAARMKGDGPEYVGAKPAPGGSTVQPFASISEQSEAINDPRYGRDRAYTLAVEKRIEISSF